VLCSLVCTICTLLLSLHRPANPQNRRTSPNPREWAGSIEKRGSLCIFWNQKCTRDLVSLVSLTRVRECLTSARVTPFSHNLDWIRLSKLRANRL
ncbi:MAG TPA: hypothetical protein VEZ90_19655, partial [Blastocatellia bacterium]|nr:hypothetical protein [Blastocatellia bacterium]